jgi:hypothetical protein
MTLGEQRRKALELLAPPPSRRHECLRDIEYTLDWVSNPAPSECQTEQFFVDARRVEIKAQIPTCWSYKVS